MTITQRLYAIGCMLFLWYAGLVIVPQLCLLVGIPIGPWQFWLSLAFLVGSSWMFHRNYIAVSKKRHFLFDLLFAFILFGLCLLFSGSILDTSFDGTWYHMDAIIRLKEGWNPNYHVFTEEETSFCEKYLNHFPKSSWIYSAAVFAFTHQVEMGKAANLQLILSCLLVAQHLGKRVFKLSSFLSWILALLIASNPVQILNLGSFYADGQLAALLFLGIAFGIYQIVEGGWLMGFFSLVAFALLANIKFTGAFYAAIYVVALLGFLWYTRAYKLKKLVLILIGWGTFTYAILGWNPYMSNLIRNGHPLYPLSEGTEQVFKKQENYPANFLTMNRFERFFFSFYAEPKWARNPNSSELKKLFSPVSLETYHWGVPDLAGFGPFVPEVLTFLLPIAIWALVQMKKKNRQNALYLLFVLLFSTFINPEAWVLRYVPQFWVFLVALLVVILSDIKWQGPAFALAIGLLLNNLVLMNEYILTCYSHTRELKGQVELVKESNGVFIYYSGWAKSVQNRLEDMGLPRKNQTKIDPNDSLAKPFTGGMGALFKKSRTEK